EGEKGGRGAKVRVGGVLISWATSASVASIARGRGVGDRRRAVRLARRGRLPADILGFAIAPPKGEIAMRTSRRPQAHASPTIRRMSAALAPAPPTARNAPPP